MAIFGSILLFLTKMDAKKKTFIEALHNSFGNITKACAAVPMSRPTYYAWIEEDEEFKSHCENIGEYIIDTVENHLLDQIKEGNTVATIFYLKTKGKKRGYVEKQELEHSGSITQNIINLGGGVKPDETTA